MAKKDILFMCQFFYPEYITSARLPYQTAVALSNEGYSVDVLAGYPSEYMIDKDKSIPLKEIKNGINITRVKYLQISRAGMLSRLVNYFSIVLSMFLRIFNIKKYESIVVYSNPPILPIVAILANILFDTKIVFVSYDVYPEIAINTDTIPKNGIISTFMNWINKQLFKRATKIVALSNEMKDLLINKRNIDADKIVVIPNWDTDSDIKSYSTTSKKESGKFSISYLGNMGIPQDFDTLLEAIKDSRIQNSNIEFNFVGHGSKKDQLKEYIKDHRIKNVFINDFLQGEEYKSLKNKTDMYVLSLKKELVGQAVPSKFYTYISENKPILAIIDDTTDIAKEIRQYKLGYQINNGETENLINYLLNLLKYDIDYNNEKIYKKYYRRDNQLKKYVALFNDII